MSRLTCAALGALLLAAIPAVAADVKSGTIVLSAADTQQLGRLSRMAPPSDWSSAKPYPGIVNGGTSYAYTTIDATFAANRRQTIYYDITVDDPTPLAFVSAYAGLYDPLDKSANYLGDPGASGNYFGVDPLFFDVVVPAGGSLRLLFNQTIAGSFSPGTTYLVQAFSSTEYDEAFATVPEPASWAMLVTGFGLVGGAVRTRRRAVARAI